MIVVHSGPKTRHRKQTVGIILAVFLAVVFAWQDEIAYRTVKQGGEYAYFPFYLGGAVQVDVFRDFWLLVLLLISYPLLFASLWKWKHYVVEREV